MNKDIKRILEITDDFLKLPAVTCFEKPFLEILNNKIKNLGYETKLTDRYLVINPSKKCKYLFSSHIDRHGLIRNEKGEFEYVAYYFKKKFNLEFKKDYMDFYLECALRHTKENISSYYEDTGELISDYHTERYNLDWKNKLVTFDLDKVPQETEGVFMFNSKIKILEKKFYAQIDNVISAAVLYHLLESENFNEQIIFTTQEEIGKSWECVIDYLNKTEQNLDIITLDTTPYENFNGKEDGFIVLRKGDENGNFNLELVGKIENIINEKNIPIYFKPSDTGMTELGRISTQSKGKYNGATIQIPTMNYHTTYETATIECLENYLKIIKSLLDKRD